MGSLNFKYSGGIVCMNIKKAICFSVSAFAITFGVIAFVGNTTHLHHNAAKTDNEVIQLAARLQTWFRNKKDVAFLGLHLFLSCIFVFSLFRRGCGCCIYKHGNRLCEVRRKIQMDRYIHKSEIRSNNKDKRYI